MVRVNGPGPKYLVPTNVGTVNHDPTREQAPAFSFGVRIKGYDKIKPSGPGPKYDVSGFNERGKMTTQQATLLGRSKQKYSVAPGPKSYNASYTEPTPTSYSFGMKRPGPKKCTVGPGPNKYPPPPCIGSHIPNLKTEPAYSILGRNFSKIKGEGPGPKYALPEPGTYLNNPPRVALLGRRKQKFECNTTPGPKYNPIPTYIKPEGLKGVSFGVKHSPEKNLVLMPEDRVEEAFVL